jgi:AcrR family transcriptional regulator
VSPRPKLRTPELRAHLLEVSVALLAQDGPSALTTRRVAAAAGTSTNAVYELFGDKGGLVRAVFFEGFRLVGLRLDRHPPTDDPRADLVDLLLELRAFVREHRLLADVMFSQPFANFDPGPADRRAGATLREPMVERVRRCIAEGVLEGDPTDIAHVLLAVVQGLIAQESAGWLGTTAASMARRWDLALRATLDGLRPQ